MRDIQDLLDNVDKYKNALLQKRFQSKKNTVAYVLSDIHPRVLKWFVPGLRQNMELEYSILKKGFSDLSIPSPLEKDEENTVLILSYIIGENVCDILNDATKNFEDKQKTIQRLADWFFRFHRFFKTEEGFRIRGDATLRNFIVSRGRIWGVDFEESRRGRPGEDLSTLCASLLSTTPMFTDEKFQLCQTFLDTYQKSVTWTVETISADISYALLERIQWRPQDEEILRKYATKIRMKGLQRARHNF